YTYIYTDRDVYADSNIYADGHFDSHSYIYPYSYCYCDSYIYAYPYSNAVGYTDSGESDHADRNDLYRLQERHGPDPRQPELQRQQREDRARRQPRCVLLLGEGDGASREQQRYDHSNDHHGQLHRLIRLPQREQC